jgi:hypothetical protein
MTRIEMESQTRSTASNRSCSLAKICPIKGVICKVKCEVKSEFRHSAPGFKHLDFEMRNE